MLGEIGRLGRETAVYGVSTVLSRILNFLLVPLYTHLLAPQEYGIVATGFAYIAFLNILYQYGMDQAYLRFASSPEAADDPKDMFSTPLLLLAGSSALGSCALWALSDPIARALGLGEVGGLVRVWAAILSLDALAVVPFAHLRLSHRAWYYVGVKTAHIAVNLALNILLLWKWRWGVAGVFWASALASAAALLLLSPVLASQFRAHATAALARRMLAFSWPYVPAGLASMAVQVIDRPILLRLTDEATVGIYQANYRLGIFMALAVNMFDAAWRPFFLERAARPEAPRLFARVLTYFTLAGLLLLLVLSLFIGDLARLTVLGRPIIGAAYWPGLAIVPVVLAAYFFNGLYINFMAQVMISKRSELLLYATGLGALVNVGLNFMLIPAFGIMGAAAATLAAYAAMAGLLFELGRRFYPVPYEYRRLLHATGVFLAVALTLWTLGGRLSGPMWLGVRAAGIVVFCALLAATRFFTPEERDALRRRLFNKPGP